jgi:hypothetical protein
MFRPLLKPSSVLSIQKSCKKGYIKYSRGPFLHSSVVCPIRRNGLLHSYDYTVHELYRVWRWSQHTPLKRQLQSVKFHGDVSQKNWILNHSLFLHFNKLKSSKGFCNSKKFHQPDYLTFLFFVNKKAFTISTALLVSEVGTISELHINVLFKETWYFEVGTISELHVNVLFKET